MRSPAELSPEQRRRELTGILAAGVLRLRKHRLLATERAPRAQPIYEPFSVFARLQVVESKRLVNSRLVRGGVRINGLRTSWPNRLTEMESAARMRAFPVRAIRF